MKSLIIRKPKFMRNEVGMWAYIATAETISDAMSDPKLTLDQKYEMLMKIGECLNEASKAGGFLNVGDFHKWMKTHNHN